TMRLLLLVIVLLLGWKQALAQKSENVKLETNRHLSIPEQIPDYKKKVRKKDKISGAFLDSLLDYSLKENWQYGKLWYYYFSIHWNYQENPTNTNAINKQYKALLEAYRSETDFDSTS